MQLPLSEKLTDIQLDSTLKKAGASAACCSRTTTGALPLTQNPNKNPNRCAFPRFNPKETEFSVQEALIVVAKHGNLPSEEQT